MSSVTVRDMICIITCHRFGQLSLDKKREAFGLFGIMGVKMWMSIELDVLREYRVRSSIIPMCREILELWDICIQSFLCPVPKGAV
jgi:hypothetical protein